MTCSFCGDEGWAFCAIHPSKDVWVPCPHCDAGTRQSLTTRAAAIVERVGDWRLKVVPLPGGPMYKLQGPAEEPCTPTQAKRMLAAITRTFHTGARNPEKRETPTERQRAA